MRRGVLSLSLAGSLLLGWGLMQNSGCRPFSNRRDCGRDVSTFISSDHPSAQFHEAIRVHDEIRVFEVSLPLNVPSLREQEMTIVGDNFPKTVTVALHPGTNIKLAETTKCPDAVQVSSNMSATVTASTGQSALARGIMTTADARSTLITSYMAQIELSRLGVEYVLEHPEKSEFDPFRLSIWYGPKGDIGGSITTVVHTFTDSDKRTPVDSVEVTLLHLKVIYPGSGTSTRSASSTIPSTSTSTQ